MLLKRPERSSMRRPVWSRILLRLLAAASGVAASWCSPVHVDVDVWTDADKPSTYMQQQSLDGAAREPRVLNFFPVPVEEECQANDGRRKGLCMNPYECRMQGGASRGPCALGFGVCCVFTATCDQDAYNNLTYFINPHFPDLTHDLDACTLKIKRIDTDIAQLKLDFVHFNLGQPNRSTGVCEEDVFVLDAGDGRELTLCGINSGQHVFFDVGDVDNAIAIRMNMSRRTVARLWEIRITQVPFAQRAPEGCLQYHTGGKGVLQTMNFAENGRHLANQDYNICMRQEEGMCSITYEPCDDHSFKLGNAKPNVHWFDSQMPPSSSPSTMPANVMEDVVEGSGDDAPITNVRARTMDVCTDRILLPCDHDDLLLPTIGGAASATTADCSLAHCGSAFCPHGERPCRIESTVVPFTVGVQFGPSGREESPEDNIGMCLIYEQQPCAV